MKHGETNSTDSVGEVKPGGRYFSLTLHHLQSVLLICPVPCHCVYPPSAAFHPIGMCVNGSENTLLQKAPSLEHRFERHPQEEVILVY